MGGEDEKKKKNPPRVQRRPGWRTGQPCTWLTSSRGREWATNEARIPARHLHAVFFCAQNAVLQELNGARVLVRAGVSAVFPCVSAVTVAGARGTACRCVDQHPRAQAPCKIRQRDRRGLQTPCFLRRRTFVGSSSRSRAAAAVAAGAELACPRMLSNVCGSQPARQEALAPAQAARLRKRTS